MNILNKNKDGLTIIETLVAVSILLMSVVMPMVIYSDSITNARYSSEQIKAVYLAQEAIELVKYRINTEFNNGDAWFSTFSNNCRGNGNNVCSIEVPDGDIFCRGSEASCDYYRLYLDADNLYTHTATVNPTKFSRTVKFRTAPPPSEDGTSVSSTVTWESGGESKSITVEEYITKWR